MSTIKPTSAYVQGSSPLPLSSSPQKHQAVSTASEHSAQSSGVSPSSQPAQAPTEPQDSSEANTHEESGFEPGAIQFGSSASEPSFTPLLVKASSREEIQQSADDSLAQLQNKRIANRLNQLSEEQLRQIKDIRQP